MSGEDTSGFRLYVHRDDAVIAVPESRTLVGLTMSMDNPAFKLLSAATMAMATASIVFAGASFAQPLLIVTSIMLLVLLFLPEIYKLVRRQQLKRARSVKVPSAVWTCWQQLTPVALLPADDEFEMLQAASQLYATALTNGEQERLAEQITTAMQRRLADQQQRVASQQRIQADVEAAGLDIVRDEMLRRIQGG